MVIDVLVIVAAPSDAAAIQQALDHPLPALTTILNSDSRRRPALLLAALAPQQAEQQVLLAQMRRDPSNTELRRS